MLFPAPRTWLPAAARPERAAALLLTAAVTAIAWPGLALPTAVLGMLAVTIVVTLAVLLRRAAHWLLGPLFFYELLTSGRRGRSIGLRCLYAGALLAAIFYVYAEQFGAGSFGRPLPPRELARFATGFFNTFLVTQFLAVLVLTPVFMAGAIADERERRRLDFLLTTDLRSHEIVCGKLAARLAAVALLLLTGLPVLALMQFLGGVEPHLLLAAFLVTLLTMLSVGALGIFISALCAKSSSALWLTYLLILGFLASCWCPPVLNAGHPGVLYGSVERALLDDDLAALAGDVGRYGVFHLLVVGLAAGWATWSVRPAIDHAPQRRNPPASVRALKPPPPPPFDPLMDRHPPPPVGDRPLLWKELYVAQERSAPALRGLLLVAGTIAGVIVGLQCLAVVLSAVERGTPVGVVLNPIVRAVGAALACIILLSIVLQAVGSVVREREQQTLDSLLVLPIERIDILWAKWLGSILCVRRLIVVLACVWLLGVATGALHLAAVPLLAAALAAYTAFAAGLGLVFSVLSASKVQAMLATAVVLFLLLLLSMVLGFGGTTAPVVFWNLAFHPRNRFGGVLADDGYYFSTADLPLTNTADLTWALIGVAAHGLLAPLLWFWSRDAFVKEGLHDRT